MNSRPNNNQLITYYLPVCYFLRIQQYPVNTTYNSKHFEYGFFSFTYWKHVFLSKVWSCHLLVWTFWWVVFIVLLISAMVFIMQLIWAVVVTVEAILQLPCSRWERGWRWQRLFILFIAPIHVVVVVNEVMVIGNPVTVTVVLWTKFKIVIRAWY